MFKIFKAFREARSITTLTQEVLWRESIMFMIIVHGFVFYPIGSARGLLIINDCSFWAQRTYAFELLVTFYFTDNVDSARV